jgi:hypothetical protein
LPNGGDHQTLRAREGIALALRAGQRLRITNTHGGQVVDTWALAGADVDEYLSMEHTRTSLGKLMPAAGDNLYSSRRRPLLTLVEDTSPGAHDTLIAACDPERYRLLGAQGYHASCAENFRRALAEQGIDAGRLPAPLNLFMHVRWDATGRLEFLASPAQAGDCVTLQAVIDATVVLSACPMDLNPINAGGPQDVGLELLPAE